MTNPSGKSLWKWGTAISVALAFASWSRPSAAQAGWLADRRYTEGPGIRTGDLELHPGIGGEVGYDSNWFLRSNQTGPNIVNGAPFNPPKGTGAFRITPSFYVSTLGQQRLNPDQTQPIQPRFITFRGGVSATAELFTASGFSSQDNISLNADGRADFNQGRPVSFGVFGAYARIIQPQVFTDPNLAFNRDDIRAGTDVTFLPGGGNLDIRAGYQFYASLYEQSQGVPYTSYTHTVTFRDRWKFRPRTALFSEASLQWLDYPNAPRASLVLNDGTPLITRGGVTGLVTDWLGTTLAAGYSATFFKQGNLPKSTQYDSLNAQAEAVFYLGQGRGGTDSPGEATLLLSSLTVGYSRDFQRSLLGNFYGSNRVYTRLEYWFGGRVVLDLHAQGEQLNYPAIFYSGVATAQVPDFTNYRLGGGLFAEYRFTQSLGLNTTVEYVRQFSNTKLPTSSIPGQSGPGFWDMNYDRLQAFLGFRYFY